MLLHRPNNYFQQISIINSTWFGEKFVTGMISPMDFKLTWELTKLSHDFGELISHYGVSLFAFVSLFATSEKNYLLFQNSYFLKTVDYHFPFQMILLSAPYCSPFLPLYLQIILRIFNAFYSQGYARSPISCTTRKRIPHLFCFKDHLCDNATKVDKYACVVVPKGHKIPIFLILSYCVTENKIFK